MDRVGGLGSVCVLTACLGCLLAPGEGPCQEENGAIILNAEEIRQMKANKMADLLNHVPGVSAGDSSVSIHGSSKERVLVDGRPINDPTSSYGAVNWSMVDPDQVERIEILRGKGGVRYGQDAGGGVILVTTRAIRSISGSIKTYGGNQDTGYAGVGVQGRSGSWGGELGGEVETTQGYTVNNDELRHRAGLKLSFNPDEERGLNLGADFVREDRGLTGLPDYPTPQSRKENETTVLSAQAHAWGYTSATFLNMGEQHNTDSSRALDQRLRVNELGEDLSGLQSTGDFGELTYGAGYRLAQASGSTFADQSEEVFSLFASQSLHRAQSPWSLTGGLRANANTTFDDVLNPELKLIYQQPCWSLTGSYSGSNNIPSFYQRYNHTSSTRPNPELGMETADNYSLALGLTPMEQLTLRTSVFYNRLSDRITYVIGNDGVGQYENFGEVTYRGGDVAVHWKPVKLLSFKASYTYLRAIDEATGLFVPAKAEHTATFDCTWQVSERLTTVFSSKYVSEVFRNRANTTTVPDYMLANIRAEYRLGRYALFTEIKNLADTTYYYADGLLGPPLTWMAGVSWRM
jgi:iron complex outermembrane receptor protein